MLNIIKGRNNGKDNFYKSIFDLLSCSWNFNEEEVVVMYCLKIQKNGKVQKLFCKNRTKLEELVKTLKDKR